MNQREVRAEALDLAAEMARLLRTFDKATFVGHGIEGLARELELEDVDDSGTLWFSVPQAASPARHDTDSRVTLALQGASDFVIASGRAEVVRDTRKLRRIGGRPSSTLAHASERTLLSFYLEEAEVWDNGGARGMKLLYAAPDPAVSGVHSRHHEERSATRLAG